LGFVFPCKLCRRISKHTFELCCLSLGLATMFQKCRDDGLRFFLFGTLKEVT